MSESGLGAPTSVKPPLQTRGHRAQGKKQSRLIYIYIYICIYVYMRIYIYIVCVFLEGSLFGARLTGNHTETTACCGEASLS